MSDEKPALHLVGKDDQPPTAPPPECPPPEPRPTRLEHAEMTVQFVDFEHCQDDDPVRVAVAAQKAARALELAIKGLGDDTERGSLDTEDVDLLSAMASAVRLFCDHALSFVAAGPGAEPWISPSKKGGQR